MRTAIFTLLILAGISQVKAEGYQVNLQSTKQAGMGHVGASMKLGAESMHFNPAGMAFMQDRVDLSGGGGHFLKSDLRIQRCKIKNRQ